MNNSKFYYRDVLKPLKKWLERKEIFAIRGPRQAGKTTVLKMLRQHLVEKGVGEDHVIFLNMEDYDVQEAFQEAPKAYIKSHMNDGKRHYFLMDEYHRVSEGGKKLKLLYDTFEDTKFIITGSSSLELSGALGKYLVGRVFFFELLPFSFKEFLQTRDKRLIKLYLEKKEKLNALIEDGQEFTPGKDIGHGEIWPYFKEYLQFGGYPEVIKAEDEETKKTILKNIYDTYVSKDIVEFLKITDTAQYRSLIQMLAAQTGGLVDYNKLSNSCESYYKEIKRWLSVLNETYVIKTIRPFHKNLTTELRKTPKVYFYDLGLRNHILNNFNPLERRSDAGHLVENAALISILNRFPDASVNFWRTTSKAEIDFIINKKVPVEVKLGNKTSVPRAMRSFAGEYNPESVIITTAGEWGKTKLEKSAAYFVPLCYL